jgi:acetolactate synthase-1/2/3 large subunit
MPSGAQLVVDALTEHDAITVFTLSGNQILSIYDAALGRDIELIHSRHEAAAVHMADAWGRLTEQPGVALLTAGPGHCNALSALYVARMAESPLVMLSGHCPISQVGQGAFQEIDQVATVRPVTKAAWRVDHPEHLYNEIAKAFVLARSGRPGPVHISLPADVLEAEAAPPMGHSNVRGVVLEGVDDEDVQRVLALLGEAERPLILAGSAMARPASWKAVASLAESTGIPALPMDSPRGVNDPWLHGATNCLMEADVVLLLGKLLDFSLGFGRPPAFREGCRFVVIDAEAGDFPSINGIVERICAEPTGAAAQLAEGAAADSERDHRSRLSNWRQQVEAARVAVPDDWEQSRQTLQRPMHPLRVGEALQSLVADGAVLACEGGEFGQWIQAGVEVDRAARVINGASGSIGGAVPMGIGAKRAMPERTVLVVTGDGAFGYHMAEFDTALRYKLPVVVVVGNDARWNAEHVLQVRNYGVDRTHSCDLLPSRYDKVVAALGGYGEFVEDPAELGPAIQRAVDSGLPACVNVIIEGLAAPTFR